MPSARSNKLQPRPAALAHGGKHAARAHHTPPSCLATPHPSPPHLQPGAEVEEDAPAHRARHLVQGGGHSQVDLPVLPNQRRQGRGQGRRGLGGGWRHLEVVVRPRPCSQRTDARARRAGAPPNQPFSKKRVSGNALAAHAPMRDVKDQQQQQQRSRPHHLRAPPACSEPGWTAAAAQSSVQRSWHPSSWARRQAWPAAAGVQTQRAAHQHAAAIAACPASKLAFRPCEVASARQCEAQRCPTLCQWQVRPTLAALQTCPLELGDEVGAGGEGRQERHQLVSDRRGGVVALALLLPAAGTTRRAGTARWSGSSGKGSPPCPRFNADGDSRGSARLRQLGEHLWERAAALACRCLPRISTGVPT